MIEPGASAEEKTETRAGKPNTPATGRIRSRTKPKPQSRVYRSAAQGGIEGSSQPHPFRSGAPDLNTERPTRAQAARSQMCGPATPIDRHRTRARRAASSRPRSQAVRRAGIALRRRAAPTRWRVVPLRRLRRRCHLALSSSGRLAALFHSADRIPFPRRVRAPPHAVLAAHPASPVAANPYCMERGWPPGQNLPASVADHVPTAEQTFRLKHSRSEPRALAAYGDLFGEVEQPAFHPPYCFSSPGKGRTGQLRTRKSNKTLVV